MSTVQYRLQLGKKQEIVEGPDGAEDDGGEQRGFQQRQGDVAELLPAGGAVHVGGLVELGGDGLEGAE